MTAFGQDRFGMELHTLDSQRPWRNPMISPSSVHAVISRQSGRLALDRQRVVTGARSAGWQSLKTPRFSRGPRKPCHASGAQAWTILPPKGFADRLMTEADAEQRNLSGIPRIAASEMPAWAGAHGPGKSPDSRARRPISATPMASLRKTHLPPQFAEVLDEVVVKLS